MKHTIFSSLFIASLLILGWVFDAPGQAVRVFNGDFVYRDTVHVNVLSATGTVSGATLVAGPAKVEINIPTATIDFDNYFMQYDAANNQIVLKQAAEFDGIEVQSEGAQLVGNATVVDVSTGLVVSLVDGVPTLVVGNVSTATITDASGNFVDDNLEQILAYLATITEGDQTITLSGDATGSGTDAITVTVVDDSHSHNTQYYTETEIDNFGFAQIDNFIAGSNITLSTNSGAGTVEILSTASGGASTLSDLTDTTITSPSADEFLKYNGSTWVNIAVPGSSASTVDFVVNAIDQVKSTTDTIDDDFSETTLNGKWTVVGPTAGTVTLQGSNSNVYDLESMPGYLLMQHQYNSTAAFRQDYTLGDGESFIAAFIPNYQHSRTVTNYEYQVGISINNSDVGQQNGDYWIFIVNPKETSDMASIDDYNGSVTRSSASHTLNAGEKIYLRLDRIGTTFYFLFSFTGETWTFLGSRNEPSITYDNIWIFSNTISDDSNVNLAPIQAWDWVRLGTTDFYPFTH